MIHPQLLSAALCLLTISKFSSGADTLSANQSLVDGDVLVSPSQMYEVGFFSPGSSRNRFLGIKNGSLNLMTAETTMIWSSNSSVAVSSPVLGNTRLPGMKMANDPIARLDRHLTSWKGPDDPSAGEFVYGIENDGLSQVSIVAMGSKKQYRSGHWDGIKFTGLPLIFYQDIIADRGFNTDGKLISIVEEYNSSSIMRLTLSYSGQLQRYIMNEDRDGWILAFSEPNDICNRYGWCGPNGICRGYTQPVCDCLRGYTPASQKEWNVFAWTKGCRRNPPLLDCRKEDGFLKVEKIKFPDTLNFQLNANMSIDECHDECLKNCNCKAYADPYFGSETSTCLMWFGDLIDVVEFTGEVRPGPSIYLRVQGL